VRVAHFPVREAGGMAWVWLGGAEAPAFPDLPFTVEHGANTCVTFSVLPCNWLQGLEGGLDSVHGTILHQTWIREVARRQRTSTDVERVELALASAPLYEAEATPYGMRAASLRSTGNGHTYARVAHFFFPLVVVVPTGFPDATQVFAFAPVDDTHHLLFFGNYGETPQRSQKDFGALRDDVEPDPRNFVSLEGDRSDRWGQDRQLMKAGHFTGVARSVIDEDALVQVSMGPRVDRSRENLSSSDVAVALARRLIIEALASVEAGELPPGSALGPQLVQLPDPFDAILDDGASWREVEPAN
jgi:phenylpropionate dioxygenase-like ring-hydroxylating dioxygenase large terminal subunit